MYTVKFAKASVPFRIYKIFPLRMARIGHRVWGQMLILLHLILYYIKYCVRLVVINSRSTWARYPVPSLNYILSERKIFGAAAVGASETFFV